jgi:glycosyltransferase involved in cell wall biosynthesis
VLVTNRPELLFVSPRFLFPADTGGAIRTTEILRGMRGGAFKVRLLSPASGDEQQRHAAQLAEISDAWECWPTAPKRSTLSLHRLPLLASGLPVPIASDRSREGQRLVAAALARQPRVVVFDFLHSAVLAPDSLATRSVLFTHNVEAEIFERNLQYAKNIGGRLLWRNQLRKMRRFEAAAMHRFDSVIAVSPRDAEQFRQAYGRTDVDVIPTGVNVQYFQFAPPSTDGRVVFTGSMDWLANIDAISWFRSDIWPRIAAGQANATMTVVGRNPPDQLVRGTSADWKFTGRVDDIRPCVQGAQAFVIPMRIGGGTRIKAFEAMAMGIPVVSTTVGVEGLDVRPGKHFLLADTAEDFAQAVLSLLRQPELERRIAEQARAHVQQNYSNQAVARRFEEICERAAARDTTPRYESGLQLGAQT